jgi:hypothetical protein
MNGVWQRIPLQRQVTLVVAGLLLLGWYCKLQALLEIQHIYRETELIDWPGFPRFTFSARSSVIWFWVPLLCAPLLLINKRGAAVVWAGIALVASAAMTTHINYHNDATFVTSFWVALWLLLWGWTTPSVNPGNWQLPARLGVGVVGMMFLGGFVGKLTPDYLTGQAFYSLYFMKKNYFIYNWCREHLSPETVRHVATWFSHAAMLGELSLAVFFWLPFRFYCLLSLGVMLGMVIISTPLLFSVMAAPCGLMLAVVLLEKRSASMAHEGLGSSSRRA